MRREQKAQLTHAARRWMVSVALVLLWPMCSRAQERSLAIINAGVSASEDAPFVASGYQFLPGEYVYCSFQIAGFSVKEDESVGTRQISLSYRVAPEDAKGVLLAEAESGEIAVQISPEDKQWIPKRHASFVLPTLIAAGTYQIHVTAQDAIAGKETAADVPFRVGGEVISSSESVSIQHFRFLRSEASHEALAVAAFAPGDTVFTAFDIAGFSTGKSNEYSVAFTATVTGPDGKPFVNDTTPVLLKDSTFYGAEFLPEEFQVLTKPSSPRGSYTLTLSVKDEISGKTVQMRQAFTLE